MLVDVLSQNFLGSLGGFGLKVLTHDGVRDFVRQNAVRDARNGDRDRFFSRGIMRDVVASIFGLQIDVKMKRGRMHVQKRFDALDKFIYAVGFKSENFGQLHPFAANPPKKIAELSFVGVMDLAEFSFEGFIGVRPNGTSTKQHPARQKARQISPRQGALSFL